MVDVTGCIKYSKYYRDRLLFSVEINDDGKVIFETKENNDRLKRRELKISSEELTRIYDQLDHIYFFNLSDSYVDATDDKSEDIKRNIVVSEGGKYKSVTYKQGKGMPLGLLVLQNLIEQAGMIQ